MNRLIGLFSQYQGLRKEIYILFFGRVVTNLGSMVWPMLTMILSQKMGFDAGSIALLMVVSTFIMLPANLIGGRLADYCILTSDNPRNEDPYDILASIEEGIKRTKGAYTVIENRREAIRCALNMAKEGDMVILAGKGHETYQEIRGVKHPFDEKVVVRELLDEMRVDKPAD